MVMCQLQRCIGRVMFMFVLLGWCCVEPVSSQNGAGSIVGEVLDGMTGVPLVGAIVTLDDDEVNQIDQWSGSSRTGAGGSGGSSGLKSMEKIQQLIQQFGKRS